MDESIEALIDALHAYLRGRPEGVDEYTLLKTFGGDDEQRPLPDAFADNLAMFRAHFVLFHTLYRLRDRLRARKAADMDIHTLCIRLLPYQKGEQALTSPDSLRAYYLDLSHLEKTTREDVSALFARFARLFCAHTGRAEALAVLGLEDPVDDAAIKQRYRKLVMTHHPDRGGDTEQLKILNAAIDVLLS